MKKKEMLRCSHLELAGENLRDFNLELYQGESLLILGNFASGKEAVRNILRGERKDYGGEVYLLEERIPRGALSYENKTVFYTNPEAVLIEKASILENLYIYRNGRTGLVPSKSVLSSQTKGVLVQLGLHVTPEIKIRELSFYEKLVVCMAKAMLYDSQIFMMEYMENQLDTADMRRLAAVMERLKREGRSFLILSERADELTKLSEHILILQNGRDKVLCKTRETSREDLLRYWFGMEPGMKVKTLEQDKSGALTLRGDAGILMEGNLIGIFDTQGRRNPSMTYVKELLSHNKLKLYLGNRIVEWEKAKGRRTPEILTLENRAYHEILSSYPLGENLLLPRNGKELCAFVSRRKEQILEEEFYAHFPFLQDPHSPYSQVLFWKLVALYRLRRFHPEILILDNPFLQLDAAEELVLREELRDLSASIQIIILSHRLGELKQLADHILYVEGREILWNE
jgi:ABC-type sugar transport system ATPase subunit